MALRFKTLCENTATFGYLAEWGFSLHVEFNGHRFLLDTGMTDVALRNANRLDIDFSALEAIVLSHGHLDHTGGLAHILKQTGSIPVFLHPDAFGTKLSARRHPPDEDIGMPFDRSALEKLGASLEITREPGEILPGVFISGEVPMVHPSETIDEGLLRVRDGQTEDDPLKDDLSVGLKTDRGLFAVFGCAHRGPVNIITHLLRVTGETKLYGVIGGLHLSRASDNRILETIEFLKDMGVQKVACSHCTGFRASTLLSEAFKDGFILNNAGTRLFFNS